MTKERALKSPDVFTNRNGALELGDIAIFTGGPAELDSRIAALAGGNVPALVLTTNVDQTVRYLSDEIARRAFRRADLVTLDGAPVVALARLLGIRSAQRNTGADLLVRQSELSATTGHSIAIVGGADTVGTTAQRALRDRFPGARVTHVPLASLANATDEASAPAVSALNALAPNVVFVCLGFPKQEEWFMHWERSLPAAVYVGAGAAVDFAAGARKRAPRTAQRLGLEWVWRVAQEPGRLAKRYLIDSGPFFTLAFRSLRQKDKR